MNTGRVRPTGTGTILVTVSVLFLAGGWWAHYPELAMMGAVGVAAAATAFAVALSLPPVPPIERNRPLAAVGDELEVIVLASGARHHPRIRRWHIADMVRTPVAGAQESLVRMPPGAVGYRVAAERRGCHIFGPPAAYWQDPLGLLRAQHMYRGDEATVLVWVTPWTDNRVMSVTTRARLDDEGSAAAAAPVLGGTSFHGLRDYEAGDDVRLVDWRATARRGGQLIVRQYAVPDPVPADLGHVIVLDTHAASYPGGVAGDTAFEDAIEIAASLCAAGARDGQVTVLAMTADLAGPRVVRRPTGQDALDAAMNRLARAERSAAGVSPWLWAARPPAGMWQEVGALTIVTGAGGQDTPAALEAERGRAPVMTLVRAGVRSATAEALAFDAYARGAVTRIAVLESRQFASAWNEFRAR
jgi:uncharacterized protein (DUF58 family)